MAEKNGKIDAITDLIYGYVQCIDDDRLEEWPEMFVEDCVYKILPRENADRGLEICLIFCDNKRMLRDRVLALREANVYNLHFDRHIVSNIRLIGEAGGVYSLQSNYLVVQTNLEGKSILFSAGKYLDKVVFDNGEAKFKEKVVIPDTYTIDNLLATPL